MDRNTLIGITLMMALLMGYFYYNSPSEAQLQRQRDIADSISLVNQLNEVLPSAQSDTIRLDTTISEESSAKNMGNFSNNSGSEEITTLSNDLFTIDFSSMGGKVASVKLNKYKRADSTDLILFDKDQYHWDYQFIVDGYPVNTAELNWQLKEKTRNSVSYYLYYDNSSYLKQTYTLANDTYKVAYNLSMVGMNKKILPNNSLLTLNWKMVAPRQELSAETERQKSTVYYKEYGETPDFISETKYKREELKGKTEWVSFKQQFFNSTLLNESGSFDPQSFVGTVEQKDDDLVKGYEAKLYLTFNQLANEQYNMAFYFGPNHVPSLKKFGHDLDRLIPLGWVIFRWINEYAIIPLFNALRNVSGNYGLVILLLTLIVKLALLPLTYKSYKSSAKMKVLKPEIDAIKEKNKGDMQKTQVETMAFYKKVGVSPMGGCLPMLLQMPILMSIFFFFPSSIELRQESFLWAQDLSRFDSIFELGFSIPFYGSHVSLFTLLMTLSTFLYTYMNNQVSGVTGQMKYMGYIMPVFFLGFFNNYAAGLTYYYFLSNMITFTQQWAIRQFFVDEDKIKAQIAANRNKKGPAKKPSSFQQKLEAMAKKRGIDPKSGKRTK